MAKTVRYLRRMVLIGAVLVCALGCGGTGGGGNAGGGGHDQNNSFAGTYQGEFLDRSSGAFGTMSLTVTTTGVISGATTQIVSGTPVTNSITGNISGSGSASITGVEGYNNDLCSFGTAKSPTFGTSFQNGTGTDTVWFVLVYNPSAPAGGGNPFAGDYAGTIANNSTGLTGIDAWTISAGGALTGSGLVDVNGVPTLASLSGAMTTGGAVTYTVTAGTTVVTTVTGTLSLAGGSLTGKLQNSAGNSLSLTASAVT